ncbi:coiled-coil domain-containing protein 137 [Boleophthalmus pectinirostris]|uniref:coiled-coil domain-containing protein 137 n=1 Tax=Boleophthalmus pectinirostris TaxID=150288 RepID=UPI00243176E1|nr:coiled-coil domain-containing protein 137 [Boleophthalmus pectinirostris]
MGKNKRNKVMASSKETNKTSKPLGKKMKQATKKAKEDHMEQIPFRLREIMRSKEQMKTGARKRKKLKQASQLKNTQEGEGDIPVPHFKRRKGESEKAYLRRMEAAARHVLFLSQNQVERKPELDPDQQERRADKGKSEKKKQYAKERVLKMQQKKLDKQETKLEKEMFVEDVPFGEVSMAPPSLSVKPRKAQDKSQMSSKNLLLNSLLGQKVASDPAKPSMARQRIMEEERQRVVEAYRHMKKQKQELQDKKNLYHSQ